MKDQVALEAAIADVRLAAVEFGVDPALGHVLLVEHRVRGWVPPGGTVEPGEMPP